MVSLIQSSTQGLPCGVFFLPNNQDMVSYRLCAEEVSSSDALEHNTAERFQRRQISRV